MYCTSSSLVLPILSSLRLTALSWPLLIHVPHPSRLNLCCTILPWLDLWFPSCPLLISVAYPALSWLCFPSCPLMTCVASCYPLLTSAVWSFLPSLNPILHGRVGGGGGAHANFKDPYLRNEHCYSNEIWWLFIKFIGEDNGVLIIPVPIKPLPWQPLYQNPLLTILT